MTSDVIEMGLDQLQPLNASFLTKKKKRKKKGITAKLF